MDKDIVFDELYCLWVVCGARSSASRSCTKLSSGPKIAVKTRFYQVVFNINIFFCSGDFILPHVVSESEVHLVYAHHEIGPQKKEEELEKKADGRIKRVTFDEKEDTTKGERGGVLDLIHQVATQSIILAVSNRLSNCAIFLLCFFSNHLFSKKSQETIAFLTKIPEDFLTRLSNRPSLLELKRLENYIEKKDDDW